MTPITIETKKIDLHDRKPVESDAYFPLFDWLRFAMASLVLASHSGLLPSYEHAGNFGVQVFFALSGWLIGGILLRIKKEQLPKFYFNRVVRIWVPYYLAFLFLILASLLHDKQIGLKWLEFVCYKATFVWNIFGTPQLNAAIDKMPLKGTGNHFWSVNLEEQFYLIVPFFLVLLPRLGRNLLLWGLFASIACSFGSNSAAVVLGVFFAVLHEKIPYFHLRSPWRLIILLVLVISSILIFITDYYFKIAPIAGATIVLLLAVPGKKSAAGGLFGGLSYQLYLNQWIGGFFVQATFLTLGLSKTNFLVMPLSIVFDIFLAGGLYIFIDRKLLAARSRLYTPTIGKSAMITGYVTVTTGLVFGSALKMFP